MMQKLLFENLVIVVAVTKGVTINIADILAQNVIVTFILNILEHITRRVNSFLKDLDLDAIKYLALK